MEYIKRVKMKGKTVGRPSKAEIAMKEFMNRQFQQEDFQKEFKKEMLNKIKYGTAMIRTGREENIK